MFWKMAHGLLTILLGILTLPTFPAMAAADLNSEEVNLKAQDGGRSRFQPRWTDHCY